MTQHNIEEHNMMIVMQELPINWKWMLILGIGMLLFGTIGLAASNLLTLASIYFFGGLVLGGGIMQIIHAFRTQEKQWGGKLQHWLIALLYLSMGTLIIWDPFATSIALTIFIAVIFTIIGIIRLNFAFFSRKQGWKWLLPTFSGLINLILAILIIATLPESALWLIGLFIAIEMLMNGWLLVLLAIRVKQVENN
jgi:uncharacterized membrane protein HdeD (DUF308 family)